MHKTIAGLLACLCLGPATAIAQEWPTRPVTMVVPFAAGGTLDVIGRVLGPRLAERLGQPVIIENVGAAAGMAGTGRVAKAAPDGYQFVYGNVGTHAHVSALYRKPPYDTVADFAPVVLIAETSTMLVARKDMPVSNLSEFIAYTKSHQEKMQFGSSGVGTTPHIACAMLNAAIGVNVTHIPYRGGGQVMQDLIGGRIDYQCPSTPVVKSPIESGMIKPIAMLVRDRSPIVPTVPTAHEQGMRGFDVGSWGAFFFPKGTPPAIIQKLNAATIAVMEMESVRQRLTELGAVIVTPERRSPAYLQQFIRDENKRWGAAIRAAGISLDAP